MCIKLLSFVFHWTCFQLILETQIYILCIYHTQHISKNEKNDIVINFEITTFIYSKLNYQVNVFKYILLFNVNRLRWSIQPNNSYFNPNNSNVTFHDLFIKNLLLYHWYNTISRHHCFIISIQEFLLINYRENFNW